jgi:hypothetical protein
MIPKKIFLNSFDGISTLSMTVSTQERPLSFSRPYFWPWQAMPLILTSAFSVKSHRWAIM